jgi:hypothetical protein
VLPNFGQYSFCFHFLVLKKFPKIKNVLLEVLVVFASRDPFCGILILLHWEIHFVKLLFMVKTQSKKKEGIKKEMKRKI